MSWKDIIKEDKLFQEVHREYVDFIEEMEAKVVEQDLGWSMQSYFDGLMPQYIKDSEALKKDIKRIMMDYRNHPHVDTKALQHMFDKLNQKENLGNLVDSLRE